MILLQSGASLWLAFFSSEPRRSHRSRHLIKGSMFSQTFQYFKREVQTRKIWIRIFEQLDHPQTLAVVIESAVSAHTFGQHLFSGVAKRRMAQVVGERNGFRQVLVQCQCTRDCAADG